MKRFAINLIILVLLVSGANSQVLKPYTLGAISEKTIKETLKNC